MTARIVKQRKIKSSEHEVKQCLNGVSEEQKHCIRDDCVAGRARRSQRTLELLHNKYRLERFRLGSSSKREDGGRERARRCSQARSESSRA